MPGEPLLLRIGQAELEIAWHGQPDPRRPTLVLLHEGLGCVATWRDFPARMAQSTGLPVLVYSRAGYGGSSPVPLPRPLSYMHDEAQETLPALLAATGLTDVVLFGHSDGASIALIFTGNAPAARVRGLILEAPHVFCEELSVENIAHARSEFEHGDLRARLSRYHGANTDCAFRGWNDAWLDPGFKSWNIEEVLPRIRVPALVIQAEHDLYGTLAQVEAIERGSGGPVVRRLIGSTHSPHRDDPAGVLAAVTSFVGELTR